GIVMSYSGCLILCCLFPITYQGDVPNTASGLMAIGALAVFPFYILLISLVKKNEQGWYV
ncbi:hypothetical protein RZN17_29870, partial [Klebsiella pneumoniae subsp. pneumoniae]|uniref:hypothetical protein n=1 Tax=Klebsiella pneumoniae TaxID=573 RepID=UPI0029357884